MTLASRLSTLVNYFVLFYVLVWIILLENVNISNIQANTGHFDSVNGSWAIITSNLALIQVQAIVVAFLASGFAAILAWIPKGQVNFCHFILFSLMLLILFFNQYYILFYILYLLLLFYIETGWSIKYEISKECAWILSNSVFFEIWNEIWLRIVEENYLFLIFEWKWAYINLTEMRIFILHKIRKFFFEILMKQKNPLYFNHCKVYGKQFNFRLHKNIFLNFFRLTMSKKKKKKW